MLLDKLAWRYLKSRGYAVSRVPADDGDYAIRRYETNGAFDYARYVELQKSANRKEIEKVWTDEVTIELISQYLRSKLPGIKSGLCHGSRNGSEVRWFRKHLGVDIHGTDISDTATQHGLVQWDFHDPRQEWIGRFDFIYTNSHDHAYDPRKAFNTWVDQLAPGGMLTIEHSMAHSPTGVTELDPFGVDPRVLPYVVLGFGEGRFAVTDMIRTSHQKSATPIWVFVITARA